MCGFQVFGIWDLGLYWVYPPKVTPNPNKGPARLLSSQGHFLEFHVNLGKGGGCGTAYGLGQEKSFIPCEQVGKRAGNGMLDAETMA